MNDLTLYHYGVKGMKWGVRRSRKQLAAMRGKKNKKSLFKAKTKKSAQESKKQSISEMSDEDLRRAVQRLSLEKQYRELNPQKKSIGKRFVEKVAKDVLIPTATNVAKKALEASLTEAVEAIAGSASKKKKTK